MVQDSSLTPSSLVLSASVSVQVFQAAERLGMECFRLRCPSESCLGQKWSGPSTVTVFGNHPEKNSQKEYGISTKAVYLPTRCPALSLGGI